jgi:predicted nucleotidyltransferase
MGMREREFMAVEQVKIIRTLTRQIIREIVQRVVKAVDPDKIVLFGSYAYGKPRKTSDLDLLIVMNSELPRHKRSIPVYDALRGLVFPKDIIVYTEEEIKDWEAVPQSFISSVLRKGTVLYEKQP